MSRTRMITVIRDEPGERICFEYNNVKEYDNTILYLLGEKVVLNIETCASVPTAAPPE